jgi:hypothetical protein
MADEVPTPIARMMMGVAGHSLLAYVQLRALAEVLIETGAITREQLEERFVVMRARELDRTIDEWFEPEIAKHIKMAFEAERVAAEAEGNVAPPDAGEIALARSMQSE